MDITREDLDIFLKLYKYILYKQRNYFRQEMDRVVLFSEVGEDILGLERFGKELLYPSVRMRFGLEGEVGGGHLLFLDIPSALKWILFFTGEAKEEVDEEGLRELNEGFMKVLSESYDNLEGFRDLYLEETMLEVDIVQGEDEISFDGVGEDLEFLYLRYDMILKKEEVLMSFVNLVSIGLINRWINFYHKEIGEGKKKEIEEEWNKFNQEEGEGSSDISYSSGSGISPVRYLPLSMVKPGKSLSQNNVGILLDVTMVMTVELGRARMRVRNILSLGEGSIIELDKLAGEPVDLLVNGKLIAKGEVVIIDENFGVRITEIIVLHEHFFESVLID